MTSKMKMKNGQRSSRLTTSPGFDLFWLGLGCSLTESAIVFSFNDLLGTVIFKVWEPLVLKTLNFETQKILQTKKPLFFKYIIIGCVSKNVYMLSFIQLHYCINNYYLIKTLQINFSALISLQKAYSTTYFRIFKILLFIKLKSCLLTLLK